MFLGRWEIDDLLTFPVNTHSPSTGAATDADSVPTYRVYEDETATAILTGSMAKLDDANTVGFYSEQITLSAANGFEVGKSYTIYISAVVGGVTGTLAKTFQVELAPATAAAVAALNNLSAAQVNAEVDTALADYDAPTFAELDARTDAIDAALVTIAAFLDTEVAAILADTNELQVDWVNGGRLDLLIDAIKVKTDGLPSDPADASVIATSFSGIDAKLDTIDNLLDTEVATLVAGVAAILADTGTDGVVLSTATQQAIADVLLGRSVASVEASAGVYTLASLILAAFESAVAGTVWTIKRTDGITTFATRTATLDAGADPIIGVS